MAEPIFVETDRLDDAKDACSKASVFTRVKGDRPKAGYMCFMSRSDYDIWADEQGYNG